MQCLGEMPPRPDPAQVKVRSREELADYTLERFEFHNGVDMVVPGILLIPKKRNGPVPAIVGLHGHGGSKESTCPTRRTSRRSARCWSSAVTSWRPSTRYFNGERVGKGPAGRARTRMPAARR